MVLLSLSSQVRGYYLELDCVLPEQYCILGYNPM
jgi:hypothetical protein